MENRLVLKMALLKGYQNEAQMESKMPVMLEQHLAIMKARLTENDLVRLMVATKAHLKEND